MLCPPCVCCSIRLVLSLLLDFFLHLDYSEIACCFFSHHSRCFLVVFDRMSCRMDSPLVWCCISASFCCTVCRLAFLTYNQTFCGRLHCEGAQRSSPEQCLATCPRSWYFRHFAICRKSLTLSEENSMYSRLPCCSTYFCTLGAICMTQ
jgi:hypothetical protein